MRTTAFVLGTVASILTLAAGCNGGTGTDPDDTECHDADKAGCFVVSEQQRIQNPDVPQGDLDALVQGNNTFALDLYQQIRGEEGNLFYSPYSISLALAMTWAGARGETETEMAAALDFKLPQDKLHPAFNALDQALASRGKNAEASDGQAFRLRVANALWGQTGLQFETSFLDTLAINYGAGMRVVDFEKDAPQAIDLINGWVDTQTEGKIKKLVGPDNIDSSTRFVLTNAIYFNAAWASPFETENTADADFTKADGSKVTVSMMHQHQETGYVAGDGFQAVRLPYDGNELAMIAILPDPGTLADFEASLDANKLDAIAGSLGKFDVDMAVPKFEFSGDFSLKDTLSKMGMAGAFNPGADFSGITKADKLVLMDVLHKSYIKVNEAGTEAAAATAVIGGTTSAPEQVAITLDHPFLFVIRDKTGTLLFVGRISNPAG